MIPPGRLLTREFFELPPEEVAWALLGKLLVRRADDANLVGRIVEVEAYLGPHQSQADPAAHAFHGPTERNRVLFGPAGHAYVFSIYGRYCCMNVSCEDEGMAGCVLLRALEPIEGLVTMTNQRGLAVDSVRNPKQLCSGPGKLCQALGLTRGQHNGADLTSRESELQIRDDGYACSHIKVTPRIGIRKAAELPLRFFLAGNRNVSRVKTQRER